MGKLAIDEQCNIVISKNSIGYYIVQNGSKPLQNSMFVKITTVHVFVGFTYLCTIGGRLWSERGANVAYNV